MSKELVIVEKEQLSSIANAVRNSTGSNDKFNASELSNIVVETLGADREILLQNKTVTPSTSTQTVVPDNGYDGLSEVTVNAMSTATQATPSINVSSSGLITASTSQNAGYVSAGTKSATKQLTVQAAQTIIPGTSDKTIASGRYLTGTQTIKGDSNLIPANIAKGTSIFGVEGTMESGGVQLETCQVQITGSGSSKSIYSISFITVENEQIQLETISLPIHIVSIPNELTCLKNSTVVVDTERQDGGTWPNWLSSSGGVTHTSKIPSYTYGYHFTVTGDGTITID